MGHMVEEMALGDIQRWVHVPISENAAIRKIELYTISFDKQGNLLVKMEMQPPEPIKLSWEINNDLLKIIDEAYRDGLKLTEVSKPDFSFSR